MTAPNPPAISYRHVQYLSDRGTVYKLKQDLSHSAAVGNQQAEARLPVMPRTLKPRHVQAVNKVTGHTVNIPIGSVTNPLWRTKDMFTLYGQPYTVTYRAQEKNNYGSGGPA